MKDLTYLLLLAPFILFAAFHIVLGIAMIATARFEKQRVNELTPLPSLDVPAEARYLRAVNESAAALGFRPVGVYREVNHKITICLWATADGSSFVRVGQGTLAAVPVRRMEIFSRLPSGGYLQTCDEFGLQDLAGLLTQQVVYRGDLPELWQEHCRRLAAEGGPGGVVAGGEVVVEIESMTRRRVERLLERRCAEYVDPAQTTWRFTLKGAVALWAQSTFGRKAELKRQMSRAKRKRPGDP